MRFNGLVQDGIVARKQLWHLFRMLLREFCAAFDIREEEGDSAGRLHRGAGVLVSHAMNGL